MRNRIASVIIVSCLVSASALARRVSILGVNESTGEIIPPNGAVSVQQLGSMAGQAAANEQLTRDVAASNADISNRIAALYATVASQHQHAIVHGYVASYGLTAAPTTNATIQIIGFQTRTEGTNLVADVWSWFSVAPTNAPRIKIRSSLMSGSWEWQGVESNSWPNTVSIVTAGGVYAAYQTTVVLSQSYSGAFFMVVGNIEEVTSDSSILPFWGGITINGKPGRTGDLIDFLGNTNHFECGIWTW